MPLYEVKPGRRHGKNNEYGPGDTVEMTAEEAAGFLDKLKKLDSGLSETGTMEPPSIDEPPEQVGAVEPAPVLGQAEVEPQEKKKPRRKPAEAEKDGEQ